MSSVRNASGVKTAEGSASMRDNSRKVRLPRPPVLPFLPPSRLQWVLLRSFQYLTDELVVPAKRKMSPSNGLPFSQVLGVREADKRAFDYFISHTAPRLAGTWDRVIHVSLNRFGNGTDILPGFLVQQCVANGPERAFRH